MDEYDAFLLNVGGVLRAARENAGMTQVQLAESVETSASAIYYYESGKVCMSAWMLRKLCDVLDVSADDVLGLEER